jgi:hypothetical protein
LRFNGMCNNPIPRDAVKCERGVLQRRPIVETRWGSKISVPAGLRVPMPAMRGSWRVERIQILHRVQSAHRKPPSDRTPTGLRDAPCVICGVRHRRHAASTTPTRHAASGHAYGHASATRPAPPPDRTPGDRSAPGARTHARTRARGACGATGGVAGLARRPAQLSRTVQRRRRRDETRRPAGGRAGVTRAGKEGKARKSGHAPSGWGRCAAPAACRLARPLALRSRFPPAVSLPCQPSH